MRASTLSILVTVNSSVLKRESLCLLPSFLSVGKEGSSGFEVSNGKLAHDSFLP